MGTVGFYPQQLFGVQKDCEDPFPLSVKVRKIVLYVAWVIGDGAVIEPIRDRRSSDFSRLHPVPIEPLWQCASHYARGVWSGVQKSPREEGQEGVRRWMPQLMDQTMGAIDSRPLARQGV